MKLKQARTIDIILLPGLHGTDLLYDDFKQQLLHRAAEQDSEFTLQLRSVNYPNESDDAQSYPDLLNWLCSEINFDHPESDAIVVIAESFSSPLALLLADRYPQSILAVVIAGGFCSPPVVSESAMAVLSLLPLRPLFMLKPPLAAIKHYLTGDHCSTSYLKSVRAIIGTTPSRVISNRVRTVLDLDESSCPNILETPVLLLQAQDDMLIPWKAQNALENHLTHAEAHWLQSPHFIFQLQPKLSAQHVINFLNAQRAKRSNHSKF